MLTYFTDVAAFTLSNIYGLNPPKRAGPARTRASDNGKYDPFGNHYDATRTLRLCSFVDKTNILVKYDPKIIEVFPP